jgi:hypothetical protein
MAKFNGSVVSGDTFTHLEVTATRASVLAFIQDLQAELATNPDDQTFHLQIERRGTAPAPGGGTPITAGDPVAVVLHRFP